MCPLSRKCWEKTFEAGSRRNAAAWAMKEKRYSQKRACALAGIDPRVYRRTSKRPADTDLRDRLKELSSERRRFGYRRLHILLKREGWHVNHCPAGHCAAMSREGGRSCTGSTAKKG